MDLRGPRLSTLILKQLFEVNSKCLDLKCEPWTGFNVAWWLYYGCVSIYKGQLNFLTFL